MILNFEKAVNGCWYILLEEWEGSPEATTDWKSKVHPPELQMVAGADTVLDFLAMGSGVVTIEYATKESEIPEGQLNYKLTKVISANLRPIKEEDGSDWETGAYYLFHWGKFGEWYQIWLCDVTKFVFEGIFPDVIYFWHA
jgi:hypothetical protein